MLECGSSGLIMYEYPVSTTCSGTPTQSTITTATDTISCKNYVNFLPNPYFVSPTNSFRINCDASEDWLDNGDYYLRRATSLLQASSAIDYTLEDCNQNDDHRCPPTTVKYGYSPNCLTDPATSMSYRYSKKNRNIGYFNTYSDTSCFNLSTTSELRYNECLECSLFDVLVDASDTIILWAIILLCTICGCVVIICCPAAKSKEPQQPTAAFQPVPPPPQRTQQIVQPAQAAYVIVPLPVQAHASLEMISVQIPMDAKPGQMITVSKSNGQQMHVQLPNDAVPGSVIQVQGEEGDEELPDV